MTKEKAMKLLRLKDGFTYKELENAYQKFKKYYSDEYKYKAHYFLDTPIQLIEIEEAYNFLKNGHFYVIPDLLFKYSKNYSNDSKDIHELSFKKSKIDESIKMFNESLLKEQEKFIRIISIYLNSNYENKIENIFHETLFEATYPSFLEDLQKKVIKKVKEVILKVKEYNHLENFKEYESLVDNFNIFIDNIHIEIIQTTLKNFNLTMWDTLKIYSAVSNTFMSRYIPLTEYYDLVIRIIKFRKIATEENSFLKEAKNVFFKWKTNSTLHTDFFKYLSSDTLKQIFKSACEEVRPLYENCQSSDVAIDNFFDKRFEETLLSLEKKEVDKFYTISKLFTYIKNKFSKMPGYEFINDSDYAKINEIIKKKYGENYTYKSSESTIISKDIYDGLKDIIENYLNDKVNLYTERLYKLKYLMDNYEEFAKYIKDTYMSYGMDCLIRNNSFDEIILNALNEINQYIEIKDLSTIPSVDEVVENKDILQNINDDKVPDSQTYLVYEGNKLSWEVISGALKNYAYEDEMPNGIYYDGIMFAKNSKVKDNDKQPCNYRNGLFLGEYKDSEKKLSQDEINSSLRNILEYYNIYEKSLDKASFECVAYNREHHSIFIISNNISTFIGVTLDGEKMYSNNPCLLRKFCQTVYKMPLCSYLIDGKISIRRKGFDLLIRKYMY